MAEKIKYTQKIQTTVSCSIIHRNISDIPTPAPPACKSNPPSAKVVFSNPPFVYAGSGALEEKINEILKFSLQQQRDDEISDSNGFVTIVLHRCFTAIGIETRIVYGERRVDMKKSWPHVWLRIKDFIIDNSNINNLEESNILYMQTNIEECYKECELDTNSQQSSRLLNVKQQIKLFVQESDMALALSLNHEHYYNYYFAMIRHMYDEYKVSMIGIDPNVRYICWGCRKYPRQGVGFVSDILKEDVPLEETNHMTSWRFLNCSRCMVASFCSHKCQNENWKEAHRFTCLPRGSVCLPPHLAGI